MLVDLVLKFMEIILNIEQGSSKEMIFKTWQNLFFINYLTPTFALFNLQWVKLILYLEEFYNYINVQVAKSELRGQFGKKNTVLKGRKDWIVPVHFVKQMSSDLNI